VIRSALIGTGFIGSAHANKPAAHPGVDFTVVHAPTLDAVFESPDIDAVLIASSTNTHAEYLQPAAKAGNAILYEKAIDLAGARARQAVDAVRAARVPANVDFTRRFDADYQALRTSVVSGEVGSVKRIQMGHAHVAVSDEYEPVANDDYAAFSAQFENGAGGLEVSRVAAGHANSLIFEVFCENGPHASTSGARPRSSSSCRKDRRPRTAIVRSSWVRNTLRAGWPWMPRVWASAKTTPSPTRPARSSTRLPASTRRRPCPAAPPSMKEYTTWNCSRP
jgi:predicted dehydrogenase